MFKFFPKIQTPLNDRIPLENLREELDRYDTARPRLDELKFVHELCVKYDCQRDELLRAIRFVRRENRKR